MKPLRYKLSRSAGVAAIFACLSLGVVPLSTVAQAPLELRRADARGGAELEAFVKASYLINFIRHVEVAGPSGQIPSELIIGIVDSTDLVLALENLLPEATLKGRRVRVVALDTPEEISDRYFTVVYIGALSDNQVRRWIAALEGRGGLIVGEGPDAISSGASVQFVMRRNNTIGFTLDRGRASQSGVTILTPMLQAAESIGGE